MSAYVIGLTGRARAGKDTVAALVGEMAGTTVLRQGFADKLKLSAARLFLPECTLGEALAWCDSVKVDGAVSTYVEDERSHGDTFWGMSGRQFLQRYGSEAHRDVFGIDFWLDAVLPPAGRTDCDLLVIPGVRFENEAQRVLDHDGEVWEIVRPGATSADAHASEDGIPKRMVTKTIINDGSLDDLRAKVTEAFGLGSISNPAKVENS